MDTEAIVNDTILVDIPNPEGGETKAMEILNTHGKNGFELVGVDTARKKSGLSVATKAVMSKRGDHDEAVEFNILRVPDIHRGAKQTTERLRNLHKDGWEIVCYQPCLPHRTMAAIYMQRIPRRMTRMGLAAKCKSLDGKLAQLNHQFKQFKEDTLNEMSELLHRIAKLEGNPDAGLQHVDHGTGSELQQDEPKQADPVEAKPKASGNKRRAKKS